jgi:uncharacterized membrane protein YeaQ/YmgE (transglycosylase-associated protein family)
MNYKPEPGADPEQGIMPETEIIAYATATTSTFTPNYASEPTIEHTPVVVTTVPADTPMHSQMKQGSKCCGCCCDFRRAVIMVNISLFVYGFTAVIGYGQGAQSIGQGIDFDDDGVNDIVEDAHRQGAILNAIGVFACIVALVGAHRYNIYMVGFNILYFIVSFIASIILTNKAFNALEEDYNGDEDIPLPIGQFVFQGAIMCVVIYPHVWFMSQVKAGIMSAETYPREEFSCCCVQRRGELYF